MVVFLKVPPKLQTKIPTPIIPIKVRAKIMLRELSLRVLKAFKVLFLGYYIGCERRHKKIISTIHWIWNLTLLVYAKANCFRTVSVWKYKLK